MSAPTNFRVEAVEQGETLLKWTNNSGGGNIGIYRSTTSGVAGFALVATVLAGDEYYFDTGLADATRYWYKASDDAGATYSSPVVSVVTYVTDTPHFNAQPGMSMPSPWEGGEAFQEQLQQFQNKQQLTKTPCDVCVQNGAIVIDCSTGCQFFRVIVDQDINSISLVGCEDCPYIDMIIPPNETYGICGWPRGCEYNRDECYEAPLSGGAGGRTAKTNGLSYGGYGGEGGGPLLTKQCCECSSAIRQGGVTDFLRITCCDNAQCTIGCGESVKLKACGGLGPYTWSKTGNVNLSATTGVCITATSSATEDTGPGLDPLEMAYVKAHIGAIFKRLVTNNCGPGIHSWNIDHYAYLSLDKYNCNQQFLCNTATSDCDFTEAHEGLACGVVSITPCPLTISGCSGVGGCPGAPFSIDCCESPTVSLSYEYDPVSTGLTCLGTNVTFSQSVSEGTGDSGGFFGTLEDIGTTDFINVKSSGSCAGSSGGCTQGTTTVTVTDAAGASATVALA